LCHAEAVRDVQRVPTGVAEVTAQHTNNENHDELTCRL
jgi:hypothetical protein